MSGYPQTVIKQTTYEYTCQSIIKNLTYSSLSNSPRANQPAPGEFSTRSWTPFVPSRRISEIGREKSTSCVAVVESVAEDMVEVQGRGRKEFRRCGTTNSSSYIRVPYKCVRVHQFLTWLRNTDQHWPQREEKEYKREQKDTRLQKWRCVSQVAELPWAVALTAKSLFLIDH